MLEFEFRADADRRSYRDLVATEIASIDESHRACPSCGFRWARPTAATTTMAPVVPVGLPARSDADREQRRRALEPTAARIAQLLAAVPGLSPGTLAIWLGPLVLDDATTDTLFFAAPPATASWTAERYTPLLMRAAEILAGRALCVQIYPADRPGALTIGELTPATASTEAAA